MKYDLISIGGAVVDETYKVDDGVLIKNKKDILRQYLVAFESGAKILLDDYQSHFGGGAANVSVAAARLGLKSAALVAVGKDERGKRILLNFRKNKVDTRLVKTSKTAVTGFSFIIISEQGEHVAFLDRGANKEISIKASDLRTIKQATWLTVSSLPASWEDIVKKVFYIKGVRKVWNPGSLQLAQGYKKLARYLKKVDILILNKDEAIELVISHPSFKRKGHKFLNQEENLLTTIKSFGPKLVAITNGDKGVYVADKKQSYYQKSVVVGKVIDTTGAGDAFTASLVVGLDKYKDDIAKAMKLAVVNAAAVLKKKGAQNGLINS